MDEFADIPSNSFASVERTEELIAAALATDGTADLAGIVIAGTALADLIASLAAERDRTFASLKLAHAVITGGLDLSARRIPIALELKLCRIEDEPLQLSDATITAVSLAGCTLHRGLIAERLTTDRLALDAARADGPIVLAGTRVTRHVSMRDADLAGGLDLTRAEIGGELNLAGATLGGRERAGERSVAAAAFTAIDIRVGGDLIIAGVRSDSAIVLSHARIAGALTGDKLVVDAPVRGLDATSIHTGRRMSLAGACLKGPLTISDASIGGDLTAIGIDIDGGATALAAARVRVKGQADFSGARFVGEVVLQDAELLGHLNMSSARIFGSDAAIAAARAHITGALGLDGLFAVGRVDLTGSHIGGRVALTAATLKVDRGAALVLSDARFDTDLAMGGGLHTVGAVRAEHVTIGGTLDLRGSHFRAAAVSPTARRTATAPTGLDGSEDQLALSLARARIQRLVMPERGDERPRGIVDLSHATVTDFEDFAAAWPPEPAHRSRDTTGRDIEYLLLDGFTYRTLVNPTGRSAAEPAVMDAARARIRWLDGQRAEDCGRMLCRQPWTALIARLEAQGLRHEAVRLAVLLARRERRSRAMTSGARWTSRFADWLFHYGLSPWRGLAVLAIVTLLMAGVWTWAAARCAAPGCLDESVFVVSNKSAYTEPRFERTYPRFNPLGYAADLSLPLVNLGYRDHWRPNAAYGTVAALILPTDLAASLGARELSLTIGGLLIVLALAQQLLGLVLSLAVLASLFGLIRPHAER